MDASVVVVTLSLAIIVGFVVAAIPVAQVARANLDAILRDDSRTGSSGLGTRTVRNALVTLQVAFAFVLLIGAGLLLVSFQQVLSVDPGFEPGELLTVTVNPSGPRYPNGASVDSFAMQATESIRALPGVVAAGVTHSVPFGGSYDEGSVMAEGYVMAPGESLIAPNLVGAGPGYFEALRIPLVRGRLFDDRDASNSQLTVIVDQRLADKFWSGGDPLGKRIYLPGASDAPPDENTTWFTVVGVVGNSKLRSLTDAQELIGTFYLPYTVLTRLPMKFAVRTETDPTNVIGAVRGAIASIDPELPVFDVRTMQERIDASLIGRRTPMLLSMGFGAVALFLAAIGIYGVLAYLVGRRTKEIGIRMALGSTAREVFKLVIRTEGVVMLVVGLGLGLAGTVMIARVIESQLYGVQPLDAGILAAVAVLLGLVALAATAVPAWRATRIDPMVALSRE